MNVYKREPFVVIGCTTRVTGWYTGGKYITIPRRPKSQLAKPETCKPAFLSFPYTQYAVGEIACDERRVKAIEVHGETNLDALELKPWCELI